ncbi:MAG: TonB-dependent receptor [candidate division WOR-3 bacterium]
MNKRKLYSIIFLLVGLISFASGSAIGKIAVEVFDGTTNKPLVGANVVIVGRQLGTATDNQGRFIIDRVEVGTYTIEVSMIGYRSQVKTNVVVEPARTTELIFKLIQSIIEVPGITITPEYFPKVKDASVSERNFNSEEIQVQPGGLGDIQRVVQAMPAVVSSGDQDNDIIVRGGNPNENLFLVDGIEIPYPNHFTMFNQQGGPISMLNALLIREVDFIVGAFPARYGDKASSVMDITLRNGSTNEFAGNLDIGMAGLGLILESPFPKQRGTWIASYHKSFLEIMAKSKVWGEMTAVPYYDNYLAKLNFKLSSNNEISIMGLYGKDYIKIEPEEDVMKTQTFTESKTERLVSGLIWQILLGDIGYGKLTLSWVRSNWDAITLDVNQGIKGDTLIQLFSTEQSSGAKYEFNLQWAKTQHSQIGFGLSRVPFSHKIYASKEPIYFYDYNPIDSTIIDSTFIGETQLVNTNARAQSFKFNTYLQHKIAFRDFVTLTLDARADYFKYTNKFYLSPRLGLITKPLWQGINLTAGYGWHYQSPAYYILLWDSIANHNLKSQRSVHYVIGWEKLLFDDTKLSVEIYQKYIDNLLIPEHLVTSDPYDISTKYLDIGKAEANGIEIFLLKKFTDNYNGTISYAWSNAQMNNPQNPIRKIPNEFDYRHVFSVSSTYQIDFYKKDWNQNLPAWFRSTIGGFIFSDIANIGLRFRYLGGRPYTPKQWVPTTRRWIDNSDLLNSARYPSYQRLDFRWDHKFIHKNWSLSWYLEIQNLLNRKNIWFYYYKNNEKEIETVEQFGFWPMAGMVIEF